VDTKLLFENESYAIRGAYFEVNKSKDHGFFEAVYQGGGWRSNLRLETSLTSANPSSIYPIADGCLAHTNGPTSSATRKIIVNLKACSWLTDQYRAQTYRYLRARGLRVGFFVNFGHHPKIDRVVH